MLVLLSPAKSLNYDAAPAQLPVTKRLLADDTAVLSKTTRGLSRAKLRELMGIKLKTRRGENLYDFWGSRISKQLNEDLKASGGDDVIVNLASNEYFKSVDKQSLKARIITCDFKDVKDGKARTYGYWIKGDTSVSSLI